MPDMFAVHRWHLLTFAVLICALFCFAFALLRFVAARHEKSDTIESALPFSAKRGYEML